MKNETTSQRGLTNINKPMLCIAVGLVLFWAGVVAGVFWWTK